MLDNTAPGLVSDAFWLLTARGERRRRPPHVIGLGAAATAMCDLAHHGEVQWSGVGEHATLAVRASCHCPDSTLGRWHAALSAAADGQALPVRFALDPLVAGAWHDTAGRLVRSGHVVEDRRRLSRRPRYRVRDLEPVEAIRTRLERDLRSDDLGDADRTLVVAAWASGCFDDLFRIHGITVDQSLTQAIHERLEDDLLAGRLRATLAFSSVIPAEGLQR